MEVPRCLGEFPYQRVVLTCPWCPGRRGDYDTKRLIARLGPRASLEDVLAALVVGCRWPKAWHVRGPNQYVPWCRARFADLGSRGALRTATCPLRKVGIHLPGVDANFTGAAPAQAFR